MIKETELRIGNILLLDNTKVIRLLWVKNNKCCVIEVGVVYPSAIVDIERLQPIKITEEILLKCGFVKTQEGCIKTLSYQSNIGLIKMKDRFMVSMSCPFGLFQSKKIKYLHELQNLYFALSKKELEINL